jgi:integrase
LYKARPILIRNAPATDFVFVNKVGRPFSTSGLSAVVCSLTGRYIQDDVDTFGIRTHAFRYIIATAWLREHPEDYLTVAHILHDNLQTVLDNYAHTTPNDGLARYTGWLATNMRPLRLKGAA